MLDLSKAIEDFDGMQYVHKATEWLGKTEDGAVLHGWPEECKLESTGALQRIRTARRGEELDHGLTSEGYSKQRLGSRKAS